LANAALALGAPLVFFALLELLLAAGGIAPTLELDDPFVGFAGNVPLFVAEDPSDGSDSLRTADGKLEFFNAQSFPRRKAPGSFRIFCLGGSTTYGRPYDDETSFAGWLRAILPAVDPTRQWEVINAGGISYASYRVARLMEELAAYEPDLFVVYTGHNEFLEERTYSSMRDLPGPVRDASAILARTRTWTAMGAALRKLGLLGDPQGEEQRYLLPETVAARLDRSAGLDLYERDDELQQQILRHYRTSLERMVAIARSAGSALVLVTPASNLRSSSPFKSQHTEGLAPERMARAEQLFAIGRRQNRTSESAEALATLDEALALDPRLADLHYERGRSLFALGRFAEAKEAFVRARDEDVCPLRAPSKMRGVLEEVAAATDMPLVDFIDLLERDLERDRGHTILGEEDFLDHVHPTIDGHRRLAVALVEAMRQELLLPATTELSAETLAQVTRQVESRIDPQRHADALAALARTLDWAGKQEDSRRLAMRALGSGAESVSILLIAGKHHALQGDHEKAMELYRRAVRIDPLSPTPRYRMGLLSIELGELEAAAAHFFLATVLWPEDAKAHERLGLVMAERGRYGLAVASLEEAKRRDPGRRSADEMIERVKRYAGAAFEAVEAPLVTLERHPSGVIGKAAQSRRDSAGRSLLHGIHTEWAEDGALLRFADTANGEFRGADVRWTHPERAAAQSLRGE
jgi:tetratricopeptide (TPR) repeat protein